MTIIIYQVAYFIEHRENVEKRPYPLVGTHYTVCLCNTGARFAPSLPQNRKDIEKAEQGQRRPLMVVRAGAPAL